MIMGGGGVITSQCLIVLEKVPPVTNFGYIVMLRIEIIIE